MLNIHRFPHTETICREACERPRECGHPCLEACHSPCRCICSNDRDKEPAATIVGKSSNQYSQVKSQSSPQSQAHGPFELSSLISSPVSHRSRQEIKKHVQAFQEYSKGGHIEADEKVIANAREQALIATDQEALEKLRIVDEEMAAALFGDVSSLSSPKVSPTKKEDSAPVRSSPDGKRLRWQETYVYGGKGERKPEVSLLD